MGFVLMILCGVALTIAKANAWFIVPNWCVWVCFGVAVLFALVSVINYFRAEKAVKNAGRRFW